MTQTSSPIDIALDQMTYAQMFALLNHTFQLNQTEEQHEITLVEVAKSEASANALHSWQTPQPTKDPLNNEDKRIPFSLVFRFPKTHAEEQGIYHISHPKAGTFEGVFFTPIAKDKHGVYFEAIFA